MEFNYLRQEVLRSVMFVAVCVFVYSFFNVLGPNISKTAGDRDSVAMDHL